MTITIYYFSATGNSLEIAKQLSKNLKAELISIPNAIKEKTICKSETIGIVFPVYCWGIPAIVSQFIHQLEANSSAYVFAVATCGSSVGNTFNQFASELAKRNLSLAAAFKVKMPGNYIPLYGARSSKTQQKMFTKAAEQLPKITAIIQKKELHPSPKMNAVLRFINEKFYAISIQHFKTADKGFWVTDDCNQCGICVKVCPVANITLENKKPKWAGHCEQCMACIQWCPKKAIQIGKSSIKRTRYHHPNVSVNEFMH